MRFGTKGDPSTDGRYMIHCHNLPHEDHDMMTQFRVGADVDRNPDPAKGPPTRPTRTATTPSTPTPRSRRRCDVARRRGRRSWGSSDAGATHTAR
jgi:hypothetical protein